MSSQFKYLFEAYNRINRALYPLHVHINVTMLPLVNPCLITLIELECFIFSRTPLQLLLRWFKFNYRYTLYYSILLNGNPFTPLVWMIVLVCDAIINGYADNKFRTHSLLSFHRLWSLNSTSLYWLLLVGQNTVNCNCLEAMKLVNSLLSRVPVSRLQWTCFGKST